jgi:ferritin
MLSKKLESELNKQLNAELYSAYLYLSMAAYYESKNLKGFANWMNVQAQEEQVHGMKIYDYINGRGGRVQLAVIEAPPVEWSSVVDVFDNVYSHEQKVTGLINNLVNIATEEKDHATVNFLQWFVAEQVEEEASASEVLEQLKFIDGKGSGIFMLDRELKQRVFSPPAATAE